MIRQVILKNFKCFENISLDFENLNLFTGINGMGKSTLIQAILLLRQTYEKNNSLERQNVILNGDYISLGTIKDLPYWYREDNSLEIEVKEENQILKCCFDKDSEKLLTFENKTANRLCSLTGTGFEYISAERLGPRRYYDNLENQDNSMTQVGTRGERTIACLYNIGSDFKVYANLRHPLEKSERLDLQVNAWLSEISPGIRLNATPYLDVNLMGLRYSTSNVLGEESASAVNMGFGVTYVLPVIVSLLKAKKDEIVIIENPEAHLHPRGQRRIGELVAQVAANGVQIIMETHSDHVLNGIRLAVKQNKIMSEKIKINYFYEFLDSKGLPRHDKTSPEIMPDGSLSNWPEGFFDEWDKAIDELF